MAYNAKSFSIEITGLCNDENVPRLDKPSLDTLDFGFRKVKDERNKFPKNSTFDDSEDIYDESTESVFDTLVRILM